MKPKLRDERGQAAIFMALFMSTMIMLFAFTTNIGMLVHAKINLQNAADAAAYAGAAVQARQLTSVAYLNWEMRRALKEFMFYYTARGQMAAMPCFPLNADGDTYTNPAGPSCPRPPPNARYDFRFLDPRETGTNEPGPGPYIPTVCIIFDEGNNYCQKGGVPGIPEFPSGGGWGVADPIVTAVRDATNQIIDKKVNDCLGRTEINRRFLAMWLFNIYPLRDLSNESTLYIGNDSDNPFPYEGIDRLGVLPRNALLRSRIDNFEEALNLNMDTEGMGATITENTMGALRGVGKPLDYFERPIQAYLSAKNNLPTVGEDNGNFMEVELTELLPNRPAADANINLKNPPILAKFIDIRGKASFANSQFQQINPADTSTGGRGNCFQFRELRTIAAFPFGVTKDPNVITYYAVRLQAQARLLFSPFGGNGIVPLSAYSAAKPFGSRVGKNLNPDGSNDGMLRWMSARGSLGRAFDPTGSGGLGPEEVLELRFPLFPNPVVEDHNNSNSVENGFTTNSHLGYLKVAATALPGGVANGPRLAGAYAPWEVGYFTPPANFQQDIIGKFEDNPIYDGKYFSLVAPVYPVNGNTTNDLRFIREKVEQYMFEDATDAATLAQFQAFLESVMSDQNFNLLAAYMAERRLDTFHFIPDPLLSDSPELQAYASAFAGRWTVAGAPDAYRRQLTSWNNQKTATDGPEMGIEPNSELGLDIGRSGYSVRFISFDSLRKGGQATNDPLQVGVQWTNPLERLDGGGSSDVGRILDDISKVKH